MVCCCATRWSICRRWATYSRTGYARLSAIAQITTASTAARPVSRVVRGAAAGGDINPCQPLLAPSSPRREARVGTRARVGRRIAEKFLDPQQLVVLRHAFTASRRARLDLAPVVRDGHIREP